MTPQRIQRKRTKGWRMPEGAVYVGRPSRWGNAFRVTPMLPVLDALRLYRSDIDEQASRRPQDIVSWLAPLRGRDLACWCPLDQPCHADVLLELANR